ncbi:MAG: glycosyl hydrolase family 17 [Opitutae bacterium]|nr:glycosyl hydrolase family 17 [Opitutae bacterium]
MRCALLGLLAFGAVVSFAADNLPGGRRPLNLELNGEWIGRGVAFSPYRDGEAPYQRPPTDEEILADLRLVSRYWQLIRLYELTPATERTLALIRREHLPMRAIIGAWVTADRTPAEQAKNRAEIDGLIRLANAYPDIVLAAAIGNEACVFWSGFRTEPANIVRWAREVRAAVKQPVTSADDYNFWNKDESRAVAAELDFIIFHAYALWNSQPLEGAMAWTAARYDEAVRFHPGVPIIIGETGWATQYDPTRKNPGEEGYQMRAEVSVAAQESYLRQHYRWVAEHRVPTILFEAFDENWKGGGAVTPPHVVEKHWGVFDAQRRPKPSFQAIIREFYPTGK